ncbi:hypothetical protein ACP4OV_019239 [Aristida adscensionis]
MARGKQRGRRVWFSSVATYADAFTAAVATVARAPARDFMPVHQEWAVIRTQIAFHGFFPSWRSRGEKLAQDIENILKIRHEPGLNSSSTPQENKKRTKPAGIELKAKEIRGSARPVGGLEKATRRNKKKKGDSEIQSNVSDAQPITLMQPQTETNAAPMGHLEVPIIKQNYMHISEYYVALDAPLQPSLDFPTGGHHQNQLQMPSLPFTTNFYNMFL